MDLADGSFINLDWLVWALVGVRPDFKQPEFQLLRVALGARVEMKVDGLVRIQYCSLANYPDSGRPKRSIPLLGLHDRKGTELTICARPLSHEPAEGREFRESREVIVGFLKPREMPEHLGVPWQADLDSLNDS